ncbi:alpha/beta fold hydrolase [Sulfitobacter porphyrae]|uniref:Alpha/beta fold hydrolase n=1 Tax=Sulfitobacter porphyrae TaxID=1246864 RepID=A0ABW2BAU7_9RHOB
MATLVTIPGIMSDARTWAPVAQDLEPNVDAVHVADTTKDATLEAMATRALNDTIGDLIVMAHSMGGASRWKWAVRRPSGSRP